MHPIGAGMQLEFRLGVLVFSNSNHNLISPILLKFMIYRTVTNSTSDLIFHQKNKFHPMSFPLLQ